MPVAPHDGHAVVALRTCVRDWDQALDYTHLLFVNVSHVHAGTDLDVEPLGPHVFGDGRGAGDLRDVVGVRISQVGARIAGGGSSGPRYVGIKISKWTRGLLEAAAAVPSMWENE